MTQPIIAAITPGTRRTTPASALEIKAKPGDDAPPSADAGFHQRESWCDANVSSRIAAAPETPLPEDVRPTHHFEIEFNACKLDPEAHGRQTRQEAELIPGRAQPLPS
jgi:hypothetical protein